MKQPKKALGCLISEGNDEGKKKKNNLKQCKPFTFNRKK
jgi:hypothetical protein